MALCQFAIAGLALWALACMTTILSQPDLYDAISLFSRKVRAQPLWWRLLADVGIAAVTMLPATLFMGLAFPLAGRMFLGDVRKLGARVGAAYLIANLGSICGAVLGAVWLLPLFGTVGGTKAVIAVNLSLGAFLMFFVRATSKSDSKAKTPAFFAIIVRLTPILLVAALFALPSSLRLHGTISEGKVVFARDGDQATVHVIQSANEPSRIEMLIDGCKIGAGDGYRRTWMYRKQVLLAHLPMILDARIRNTLNVGLGSATTLSALASHSELETLDCVEINRAVVDASRLFRESSALSDPRVRLVVEDAVHFLLRQEKRYDLIVSDGKQDPFFSGNAVLLCKEYYEFALNRLTDDGLFVQWIPLAMYSGDFRTNLRTLCDVFENVELFYFPSKSLFMVASPRPVFGRRETDGAGAVAPNVYEELAPYGIDGREALLSRWTAGREQLQQVLGAGPISTWDHLILDYAPFQARPSSHVARRGGNPACVNKRESPGLGEFALRAIVQAAATCSRGVFCRQNEARRRKCGSGGATQPR